MREVGGEERSIHPFKTGSPIRITPFHGLIQLGFLVLLIAGGTELRIVGALGLIQNTYNILTRDGTVVLEPYGVRIRTQIRITLPYTQIERVEKYEIPPLPEWKRWLYGPSFENIQHFFAEPALAIYLNTPRRVFRRTPFPIVLKQNMVRIYLNGEDEEKFLAQTETRLVEQATVREMEGPA